MHKYLIFVIVLCAGAQYAQAKDLTVPSKGYIVCKSTESLETIANMLNVGEKSIANIYYRRLKLQRKCDQLRIGEVITIVEGGAGSNVVRIVRRADNRKYFMLSRTIELGR